MNQEKPMHPLTALAIIVVIWAVFAAIGALLTVHPE